MRAEVKAAIGGAPPPYDLSTLTALALHCTVQEDQAAILAGVDAMVAGKVLTLDELDHRIRSQLAALEAIHEVPR